MVEKGADSSLQIVLIDFGFSAKYLTPEGCHIDDKERKEKFKGNIMFASLDQMEFKQTSRKDDMVSWFYLLLYMLNGKNMPGFADFETVLESRDPIAVFK